MKVARCDNETGHDTVATDRDERDDRVRQGLQLLRHRGPGAGQAGAAGVRHPPLPQVGILYSP